MLGFLPNRCCSLASLLSIENQQDKRQELARQFSNRHLEWTQEFFDRVEQQAESEFYQGLARVSRSFLFA